MGSITRAISTPPCQIHEARPRRARTLGFMVPTNCQLFQVRATSCPCVVRRSSDKMLADKLLFQLHKIPGCVVKMMAELEVWTEGSICKRNGKQ